MKQINDLIRRVRDTGVDSADRTGTGKRSCFGAFMQFDLSDGTLPITTTRSINYAAAIAEMLWFISGSTNNNTLRQLGANFWSPWASQDGQLGRIYGEQWRNFGSLTTKPGEGVDQISELIKGLIEKPFSRRHVVMSWNPLVLPNEDLAHGDNVSAGRAVLPACHTFFQCSVRPDGANLNILDLRFDMRSNDLVIGLPYNLVNYGALLHMLAKVTGMRVGTLTYTAGDVHIYHNHLGSDLNTQLSRTPKPPPQLLLAKAKDIFDFQPIDFLVVNYIHHPKINYAIAV